MNKNHIRIFIAIFISIHVPTYCLDIPNDLKQEVNIAVKNGKTLYNSYLKGPNKSKEINRYKKQINDFCNYQYNTYNVGTIIYLIAESNNASEIVFGKHYKIMDDKIIVSTKSCIALPKGSSGKNEVGTYITHILSDAPTEFHVFISLKFRIPIFVGTSRGVWKVEAGNIEFLETLKD